MSRVAAVTGAGRGIGAAISSLLRAHDWTVIGIDREWPDGPPDGSMTADLGDVTEVAGRLRELPRLDGLVNNAAVSHPQSLAKLDPAKWSETLEVNLTAAFVLLQATADLLGANQGSVVNLSSVHAMATSPGNAAYAAAKAGLAGLTRSAAIELGPRGVRVNAVLPGAVDTGMLLAGHTDDTRTEALARLTERTPLRRVGRPSEVAEVVWFLLDNERSSFVTGQTLVVDGGVLTRLASE